MSMYQYLERERETEREQEALDDAWDDVDLDDYSEGWAASVIRSWMTDEHYHIGRHVPSRVADWFAR